MNSLYGPAYRIITPKLVLRCWEPADTPALAALIERDLDFLREWLYWARDEPQPLNEKLNEVRRWRADFDLDRAWSYAALDAASGELVGGVLLVLRDGGLGGETVGWFGRAVNGRGYHTEASAALTRAAFQVHGFPRVQAVCQDLNAAAIAVCNKLGFRHDGTIRRLIDGRRRTDLLWSMLADEFEPSPAAGYAAGARAFDALGNRLF